MANSTHTPAERAHRTIHAGGEWLAASSGATREILDPADAVAFAVVAEGDEKDTDLAVAAARRAFDAGDWPHTPVAERAALLRRVAGLLVRDREKLGLLESRDAGKTVEEGRVDIDCVADAFRYFADLVAGEAPGRVVDAGSPEVHSVVVHEPVGVCAMITPWNYPLLQASWKIAPALAAGNTFVIKPSEITPMTTIALIDLLVEAGLPTGVANIVTGPGHTVGARLAEHPDVDLVSFTGGLTSGVKVAQAAAVTVKKVALELGGKNPNVVFADACATEEGFDTAVDQALNAAFMHSGSASAAAPRRASSAARSSPRSSAPRPRTTSPPPSPRAPNCAAAASAPSRPPSGPSPATSTSRPSSTTATVRCGWYGRRSSDRSSPSKPSAPRTRP